MITTKITAATLLKDQKVKYRILKDSWGLNKGH